MPPKKPVGKKSGLSSKDKTKIVEDKTFGLKNKNKSKKVQKFVQQVKTQVDEKDRRLGGQKGRAEVEARRAKKLEEERFKKEVQELTAGVVVQPKVAVGVDPKSVLCEFFKAGVCTKGSKCKFSHDLEIGRKTEKRDMYTDVRADDDRATDTMDLWDDEKLHEVVEMKSRVNENKRTEIVCKYFLKAIESEKYGWFWECPNGPTCMYRHALPPGFVLKKKEATVKNGEDGPTLEELLDTERAKLQGGTSVTEESFKLWKAKRAERKAAEEKESRAKKDTAFKSRNFGVLSGMDLFQYDPSLFVDDDEALDEYMIEPVEDEGSDDEVEGPSYSETNSDDAGVSEASSMVEEQADSGVVGAFNEKLILNEEELPEDLPSDEDD